MLPCLTKKFLGMDCFGCGMQRALALVLHGEWTAAFKMYPAIYTLILLGLFLIFNIFVTFKYEEFIKKWLFIINISIIVISYLLKITH
ncbi:DUF2752 domain-containing protein [Formosa sp. S-31]